MSLPRLDLVAAPPVEGAPDPVAAFAAQQIQDGDETVTIAVVYAGHESAPDILTVDRSGAVVAARSAEPGEVANA